MPKQEKFLIKMYNISRLPQKVCSTFFKSNLGIKTFPALVYNHIQYALNTKTN